MTSAYSSRILTVFASSSATGAGIRWSRSRDRLPVESIRMSPGSSIAAASSTVTTPAVRSSPFPPRASIRSLSDRSIAFSGQNPSAQFRRSPSAPGEWTA